jgi:hypothetical protein
MTAMPPDASRGIVVNERRRAGTGDALRRWLATGHRRFVVVSGSAEWARTAVIQWPMIAGRRSAVRSLTGIPGRQAGQQATQERRHPPPRLDPGEPATDPQHQLIEFPPPAIQV